jgi:hypothetical protein
MSAEAHIRGGNWLVGEGAPTIKLSSPLFGGSDAYFKPLTAWQPEHNGSSAAEADQQIAAKLPESF